MEEETQQQQLTTETKEGKSDSERQAHNWGMFCHLSALLGFIWFPISSFLFIPFGHLLGPLVIWLIKRQEHAFIDEQGKEALNFQITMTIGMIAASFLSVILIGLLLYPVIGILILIFCIQGAMAASKGEEYKYPFALRLIQ